MAVDSVNASIPDDCSTEYHLNFDLPLPSALETRRVKLIPFIPSIHGEPFFSAYKKAPELNQYLPISFPTYPDLLSFAEDAIRSIKGNVLFAIIDKTKQEDDIRAHLAGIIGLFYCSPTNRVVEIGPVIILPEFQRTFVTSNAIGALLKYLLDVPSEGGQGFRRVAWSANPANQASVTTAERMGFKKEGILRWTWCLPPGIAGKESGKERGAALGRDSVVLAICWDDWESGGKENVERVIERTQ
ncbi:acyl-CoA N-acyltransferase [Lyophyllum atratum]|nr:acyl-CoA N-acyltransferase [Lyophyllum atratum]